MDGGYTCVLDTKFVWSLSTIVRWIASQPECLSILTLTPPFPPSLPHIQLNCHPDVLNPSLPRFLNHRPLRPPSQSLPPSVSLSSFHLVRHQLQTGGVYWSLSFLHSYLLGLCTLFLFPSYPWLTAMLPPFTLPSPYCGVFLTLENEPLK